MICEYLTNNNLSIVHNSIDNLSFVNLSYNSIDLFIALHVIGLKCHIYSLKEKKFNVAQGLLKHACVDFIGVSLLVGLRDIGFVARQTVLKAKVGKSSKHKKTCVENQHAINPFVFDTFGSLAPDAVTFLKRVQQVVDSNSTTPKNDKFVFNRIDFVIQKRVATQLVVRLHVSIL